MKQTEDFKRNWDEPGEEFAQLLGSIFLVVAVFTFIVSIFVIESTRPPEEDYLVSQDMADYMMKQGHGREFSDWDME